MLDPRLRCLGLFYVSFACFAQAALRPESGREPPISDHSDATIDNSAQGIVLVEGQITDPVGGGGREVTVTLHRQQPDGTVGEAFATTTTNEFGDFRIRHRERISGDVVLRFAKNGFATSRHDLTLQADDPPPFVAEELQGNLTIRGRVEDASTSQSVAGAEVTANSSFRDGSTVSDEHGGFEFQGWAPGSSQLTIEANGYGREHLELQTSPDGESRFRRQGERSWTNVTPFPVQTGGGPIAQSFSHRILVKLRPERILDLTVVDNEGKPISAAVVDSVADSSDDFRSNITDELGKLVLRGVPYDASVVNLRLTHPDHVSSEDYDRRIGVPSGQKVSSHQLVMIRSARITGLVTDAVTQEALYGARVTTGNEVSDFAPRDWTDEEGRFEIVGARPGATVLTVVHDGYAPEIAKVEAMSGTSADVQFRLDPAVAWTGVVRAESGAPVAGALVQVGRWRGQTSLAMRRLTDAQGRFVLDNPPRDEFEVIVMARDFAAVRQTIPGDRTRPDELRLTPLGAMERAASLKVGEAAPSLEMTSMDGAALRIPGLDGKVILLDFWATWCAPCVAEVPNLRAVHQKLGGRLDFQLIGVSLDLDEATVKDFVKKHQLAWPQVVGDAARKAAERYNVTGIPAVFLIGPDGKLLSEGLFGPQLPDYVEQFLKEAGRKIEPESK